MSQIDVRQSAHAVEDAASRRKFWRTLAGVLLVQAVALALLWLLQTVYGL